MRLNFLDRIETQATRMTRMMDRLGVDVVELANENRGMNLAHARFACLGCGQTEACQSWLDGEAKSLTPHDFCVNAELFEAHARKA